MPSPLPTKVLIDPPIADWRPAESRRDDVLAQVAIRVNDRAKRLSFPAFSTPSGGGPVVVTGHQAQLWHPGILAKDIAGQHFVQNTGGAMMHLLVDQDEHPIWSLDWPKVNGEAITVSTVELAPTPRGVSTGFQPALPWDSLRDGLESLGLALPEDLPQCETAAEQSAYVTNLMREPITGRLPILCASDLASTDAFATLVERLRQDPEGCVRSYNHAAIKHRAAKLRPLLITRELVELPLWSCRWMQPRQRVFADIADSRVLLIDESGEEVFASDHTDKAGRPRLMPRALLMTALVRSTLANLFIHGTGGGHYDKAMEQWWSGWPPPAPGVSLQGSAVAQASSLCSSSRTGKMPIPPQTLAPMVVVSADVHLGFEVPFATQEEVEKAVWFSHHLPHNITRIGVSEDESLSGEDRAMLDEKASILADREGEHDKASRLAARKRLREINAHFAQARKGLLEEAVASVDRAKLGLANAAIAARRDWALRLYPVESLQALAEQITGVGDGSGTGGRSSR